MKTLKLIGKFVLGLCLNVLELARISGEPVFHPMTPTQYQLSDQTPR